MRGDPVFGWIERLEPRRLLSDVGQPDPTFGDNGVATSEFIARDLDQPPQIVVTPQGKAIAVGAVELPSTEWAVGVVRYNTNGSIDTSFGTQGKTTVAVDGAAFYPGDAALQSDGKLLVAGSVPDPALGSGSGVADSEFIILRFNTDGTPDNSFGTNGVVRTTFTDIDPTFGAQGKHLAVSSTGTIAVGGFLLGPLGDVPGRTVCGSVLAVYDSGGGLLTSFSSDGRIANNAQNQNTVIMDLAWQSDGKLLVGGTLQLPDTETTGIEEDVILRYNINGTPDSSFDSDGKADTPLVPSLLLIQPDNKILVGGLYRWEPSTNPAQTKFAVARHNANGALDTTFAGGTGVTSTTNSAAGVLRAMNIMSDGHIRLAGVSHAAAGNTIEWLQYSSSGTPDLSFSKWEDNGSFIEFVSGVTTTLPANMSDAVFASDDKLLAVGDSFVARVGRDDIALGNDGTLWVDGTSGNDAITIAPLSGGARLVRNGGTTDFTKPVTAVELNLLGGNNTATITLDVNANVKAGAGADSISTAAGNDAITDSGGNDTIATGDGNDTIFATDGSDSILTGNGNDTVTAKGSGVDTIVTGAGDDSVICNSATVNAGDGHDTVDTAGSCDITLGSGDDKAYVYWAAPSTIAGNDGNDTIDGSDYADVISGGAGDDVIRGHLGDNSIDAGDGNDWVEARGGRDTINGGSGADSIYAGDGDNLVYGGEGDDYIQSGTGSDTIWGEIGYDSIKAGFGDDLINGGAGKDHIWGQQGNDRIYGRRGNDALDGGPDDDRLVGDDNQYDGGDGYDKFFGSDGNDVIYARNNDADYLDGGLGNDTVYRDDPLDQILNVEVMLP